MTSGEWDLRALRALEEEEQALFQSITEPEQIKRSNSIHHLPPIAEVRSLCDSIPSSPILPLPPSILRTNSTSSKLLTSISSGIGGTAVTSAGSGASAATSTTTYCSSSCSSRDSFGSTSRKYQKNQESHQLLSSSKSVPNSNQKTNHRRQQTNKTHQGNRRGPAEQPSVICGADCVGNFGLHTPSPKAGEPNDMMAVMMFLSSTHPHEVVHPIGNVGKTSSSIGTSLKCPSLSGHDDEDDNDDENVVTTCRGIVSGSKQKKLFSGECNGGGGVTADGAKRKACHIDVRSGEEIVDYELEDHIKHCSCSCNHMGYGNSMDYQTTGFGGGLPDVTEHSNVRRTASSRQDSISNSESAEVTSITNKSTSSSSKIKRTKTKEGDSTQRKFYWCSISALITFLVCAIIGILAYYFFFAVPSRNSHQERLKIVKRILRDVPLVDGHNDFAWNVRKYAHSSLEVLDWRHNVEHKTMWAHRPEWSQTDIQRLKQGLVGAQIWSAYVPCEAQGLDAVQLALEQIDIIHRLVELHSNELDLVVSSQEILTSHRQGRLASLIGIEGGHALGSSLGVLRSMHSLGARYITLTHQCDTSWAGSSSMSMDKGLSQFGKAVVKEMNRLGMMIDLSHSSDTTARDVFEVTRAPIIFSHSAARTLCNSTRNVPDDILRAVADNGGLIMISFTSQLVACADVSTLQDVVAHINYIRSIAGIQHIGIGAGYDGIDSPPLGLEDVTKYPNLLAKLLEDPIWSEEDVGMFAGKNFLRVMKSVENVRDYWKRAAIPPLEVVEPVAKKTQCAYMSS